MFNKHHNHGLYFLGGFALGVSVSAAVYYAIQAKIHEKALELATDAVSYVQEKYEEVFAEEKESENLVPLTDPPVGPTNV